MRNLDTAAEVVQQEMDKLDMSAELCIEAVSKTFQDLMSVMDERRIDVIQMVKTVRDEKKRVLKEQMDIIEAEKCKVQGDCQGLQHQIEVRNITKKISDLNEKLDISTTLLEPRENSFMKFEFKHNSALSDLMNALNDFGRIRISKTFPALCSALWDKNLTRHLKAKVTVVSVDYHGNPRTSGSDPLEVELRNEQNELLPVEVIDRDDGTYQIYFTPKAAGQHRLHVSIFERPIRDSPFTIEVTDHNNPVMKVGKRGLDHLEFVQPVNVVVDGEENIIVLDAGNSRIKILDSQGNFRCHLGGRGLEQHSSTGLALTPDGNIAVVNWRTKFVTKLNYEGELLHKFTYPDFKEPTILAVNRHGEVIVADTGLCRLLVFDASGNFINKIGVKGDKPGQFKVITSLFVSQNDEILVTDSRIQVFSRTGKFLQEIGSGSKTKGQYGGVTMDTHGNILATRTERGKSFIQVFNPSKKLIFEIDSHDDKLRRPSGIAALSAGRLVVADLGNDCIKVFRYYWGLCAPRMLRDVNNPDYA